MSDGTQCKASVSRDSWHRSRCERRAVRDGWCAQHHPDAEKARVETSRRRYQERIVIEAKQREEQAVALLTKLGYSVSPPPEGESR